MCLTGASQLQSAPSQSAGVLPCTSAPGHCGDWKKGSRGERRVQRTGIGACHRWGSRHESSLQYLPPEKDTALRQTHMLAQYRYVQRGGRNSVSLDYQIIIFFPEIIDCEKEENKRFFLVTHWRAPTTESTVVGLGLIPPTSKSANS